MDGDKRLELAVRLKRRGNLLERTYHIPVNVEMGRSEQSWSEVVQEFPAGLAPEPLSAMLDRGDAEELQDRLSGAPLADLGQALFALLFGAWQAGQPPLAPLLGGIPSSPANPIRHPVRLHICTDDPLLAGLPWRLTAWQGCWLCDYGWTFELSSEGISTTDVQLPPLPRILVLAPLYVGKLKGVKPLPTQEHLADLRHQLAQRYPSYQEQNSKDWRVVHTRQQLEAALEAGSCDVFYYFGHGEIDKGQPCLVLGVNRAGAIDGLAFANLARMLVGDERTCPRIAYLNTCHSAAGGFQAAAWQLGRRIPVVVANRTTAFVETAGPEAQRFMRGCLLEGRDPVVVHNRIAPGADTRCCDWATGTIHTRYWTWRADPVSGLQPAKQKVLLFDRNDARGKAAFYVSELLTAGARRVESLVVVAAPGNHLEWFVDQAVEYIHRDKFQRVHVGRPLSLSFDLAVPISRPALEEELRQVLGIGPEANLESALRRAAPQRDATGAMPLLWLDWRIPVSCSAQPLRGKLKDWLEFGQTLLAHHCPNDIRLVNSLCVLAQTGKHENIIGDVEAYGERNPSPVARCTALGALGDAARKEIFIYLVDHGHCPLGQTQVITDLIWQKTKGRYEETVRWLMLGAEIGWNALESQLRKDLGGPAATPKEDEY